MNARGQRLRQRAAALRAVREFFADRGYLEIDAPIAVVSPGLEPHLDAFELARPVGARRYLHTSPEYALKRALGEGLSRIYWLGSCFRDETPSATHSPEFTMLEWYGVGLSQEALMDETAALVAAVCRAVRGSHEAVIERHGRLLDLGGPGERLSVRAAFVRYAGVDPWQHPTAAGLYAAAQAAGVPLSSPSAHWDDVFFQIMLNAVEPHLGVEQPTFLYGWPKSQAALARLEPDDPTTARRFELYAGGFELANAFDELVDAEEQHARFRADQATRQQIGASIYPIDFALLSALRQLEPTAGIALGFDRLVMLVTGAERIDDVRVQPW